MAAGNGERTARRVDGAGWWFGLGYLVLALLAASVGTVFSISVLGMAGPDSEATHEVAREVATWLLGCLLVGLSGPVAFALAAGVPQRLWRRPGWWAGLVVTTAMALLSVAWLVFVLLFMATGATNMMHSMILTPLTPVMLVLLLATGFGTRALVRAARRAADA